VSQPYVGEIRIFAGNFAPAGWALCNGQLLPISENETLFNLIGTTYGGDGQETFALPDLQGRTPVHAGQGPGISQNYQIGEEAGVEQVTLSVQQMPSHNHPMLASANPGTQANAAGNTISSSPSINFYIEGIPPDASLNAGTLGPAGGGQPHENVQPYLCINYIISLFGIFPHQ
jgi:microcystin-dependent protein